MGWCRQMACLLLLFDVLNGCVSYAARVSVTPADASHGRLSDADTIELVDALGRVAATFGLYPNPRLNELRRTSEESWVYDDIIIADYGVYRDGFAPGPIILVILRAKKTGGVWVLIRDLNSLGPTKFTSALENAVTEALAARFGLQAIEVKRELAGPDLGP